MKWTIRVDLIKVSGGYVAQCPKNREILVTGKTKTEAKQNLKQVLKGYVKAWPETKHRFFTKDNQMREIIFEDKLAPL